jgi:hypothetical protein
MWGLKLYIPTPKYVNKDNFRIAIKVKVAHAAMVKEATRAIDLRK